MMRGNEFDCAPARDCWSSARLVRACPGAVAGSGLNSLPLPGIEGRGPGAFTIQAQMPDVDNIEPNSRVRVADVTVGNVTKIERQGWNALVTMDAQRRCPAARQRDGQARTDQLAGFTAHRTRAPDRCRAGGQAARRFADPVEVGGSLPEHRADVGRRRRCCSTVVGSARFRTSPRRSAPPWPAAKPTCAA